MGIPAEPGRLAPGGFTEITEPDSVHPYPSRISLLGTRRSHCSRVSAASGAAPQLTYRSEDRSKFSSGWASSIWTIAGTSAVRWIWCCWASARNPAGSNQRCSTPRARSVAW